MRIGLDARLAGKRHGGIGRYTEELLRNLVSHKEHEWVVFLFEHGQLPWLEKDKRVKVVYTPIQHYSIAEQLRLPAIFAAENLDLLHVPHFNVPIAYTGPFVVTIHDLLWHERKDKDATTLSPWMHTLKYSAYKFVSESAIRKARLVFSPTQHVAQIVKQIHPQQNVVVTPEGISAAFTLSGKKEVRPYRYVVYTGSLYPHKNVTYILDMMLGIPDIVLIVISGRSVFADQFKSEVRKRSLLERVLFEEKLEDQQVAALYRGAEAVIIPSFSEGFGLPALEAMASGALVLASDIPVFHEVYGKGVVYIDPHDSTSGIRAFSKHTSHKDQRRTVVARAQEVVSKYDWKTMADQTCAAYSSCLSV